MHSDLESQSKRKIVYPVEYEQKDYKNIRWDVWISYGVYLVILLLPSVPNLIPSEKRREIFSGVDIDTIIAAVNIPYFIICALVFTYCSPRSMIAVDDRGIYMNYFVSKTLKWEDLGSIQSMTYEETSKNKGGYKVISGCVTTYSSKSAPFLFFKRDQLTILIKLKNDKERPIMLYVGGLETNQFMNEIQSFIPQGLNLSKE